MVHDIPPGPLKPFIDGHPTGELPGGLPDSSDKSSYLLQLYFGEGPDLSSPSGDGSNLLTTSLQEFLNARLLRPSDHPGPSTFSRLPIYNQFSSAKLPDNRLPDGVETSMQVDLSTLRLNGDSRQPIGQVEIPIPEHNQDVVDSQKLFQNLGIRSTDNKQAQDLAKKIHEQLLESHKAAAKLSEAIGALLALSPREEPTLFDLARQFRLSELSTRLFFPTRDLIDEQVTRWEGQMKIAQLETSTWSGFLNKKFIEVNNAIAGPLNKRLGKFGLALVLAGVGSSFPAVIAGKFLASAYFSNVASSYIGNYFFSKVPYPANAILDNIQWQVTSIGSYYIQNAIESQGNNLTTDQPGNLTTRQLGDYLAGPLSNLTTRSDLTITETGDFITAQINHFLAQHGIVQAFQEPLKKPLNDPTNFNWWVQP
jgi:hypothetical protein